MVTTAAMSGTQQQILRVGGMSWQKNTVKISRQRSCNLNSWLSLGGQINNYYAQDKIRSDIHQNRYPDLQTLF